MKIAALHHGTEPDATRRLHAEAQKCKQLGSEVGDEGCADRIGVRVGTGSGAPGAAKPDKNGSSEI
jgi:hypothetical protein